MIKDWFEHCTITHPLVKDYLGPPHNIFIRQLDTSILTIEEKRRFSL